MFHSFFPNPRVFFLSALGWFLVMLGVWHGLAIDLAPTLNLVDAVELGEGERAPFMTQEKAWVYLYIFGSAVLFCIGWFFIDRNKWYIWSVLGTTGILVVTYFSVQISVWLNDWYRDFYDLIQKALTEPGSVELSEYFGLMSTAFTVLVPYILFLVMFAFYTSHYTFRWRTAMNEYYMHHWDKLRHVEGAAQRVQEDTMRFADIVEGLGSAFVRSIMTLLAFLPILWTLSEQVTEIPFIGKVDGSLVFIALISSIFGTILLASVGYRLPGLQFENQKVEAAYRKELVYGEDSAERADPGSVVQLFNNVRKNYFRLFFNYTYFNVFRYAYLQGSSFVPLIALGPTIVAGTITFGMYRQISNAFQQVENSFQFLVNSWTTIIELMSIHKRLRIFERAIDGNYTGPVNTGSAVSA